MYAHNSAVDHSAGRSKAKASFFRGHPLFAEVSGGEADAIEHRAEVHTLKKRQVLWSPGDAADRVYWVRSGILRVNRLIAAGRELTLHLHAKGDLVGEVAAFSANVRDSLCDAYEETVVLSMPKDELSKLMRQYPDVGMRVAGLLSDRRMRMEQRIAGLLFQTAHARLASLFLELTRDFGVRDSRGTILNLKLTHREMAALIGSTRETVSFAVLDLRNAGVIETEAKRVVVLDEERLRALIAS